MFEIKSEHTVLFVFGSAFMFVACCFMYQLLKNWISAMKHSARITEIYNAAERDGREISNARSKWTSSQYDMQILWETTRKYKDDLQFAGKLDRACKDVYELEKKCKELEKELYSIKAKL